ncbi:heme transporter hrg1-A-like isoform X1 [Hylaeus volcanicus]|uniref:heme transporter hrg1-A-like isoform X1 n=1 Tax=Hylaeus volcanicus TaxID=313075 RepID=UPI0023B7785E|nr:heme transporter hrg1-A-like isoform X1 [Hylaeus volcanicus]
MPLSMPPYRSETDFPCDAVQSTCESRSEDINSKMSRTNIIHLIISGIGVIVGVSACIVFFIAYKNHDVGFWSILSGILAAVCFHLHWIKGNASLERWHTKVTLRNLNVVGFVSAVASITAMIWYLFLTFYYKIPLNPIAKSTAISAVWSMICGKWAIILVYYSHKYELIIEEGSVPILTENNA